MYKTTAFFQGARDARWGVMFKQRTINDNRALFVSRIMVLLIPALFSSFPSPSLPHVLPTTPVHICRSDCPLGQSGKKKQRSAAPLLSDTASGAHITQAPLVLQHKLLVANDVFVTQYAADAAAVGCESGELARVALLLGAVGSRERFDDSTRVSGGDGIGWDVLDTVSV